MDSERDQAPFTGVKRESNGWGYYLSGRRIGEHTVFTQAQAALRELQGQPPVVAPRSAEQNPHAPGAQGSQGSTSAPVVEAPRVIDSEPILAIEAELLPKDDSDTVLLITSGERSWPGSLVVEKEHVEALIHRGVKRPPRHAVSVTEAILALEKRGYQLEMSDLPNPLFGGRPVGKWFRLPGSGYLQERRAARFHKAGSPSA